VNPSTGGANVVEFDYLVVGAGASGMAITDELLTHTDGSIGIVDRRSAPGGHWLEAYPFVRLHQPSSFYGVSSLPLGHDSIDAYGTNAGFYERAGANEICAYYQRVMETRFLPSRRVRWLPSCEYDDAGRVVARLTGEATPVRARRRIIDTTYNEGRFPASSPPPFEVADGVQCVPAGALSDVRKVPDRYVIVGAGKTALDACVYLLERGVDPDRICWIKSREGRWLNRRYQQPLTLLGETYRGAALQFEAMAESSSIEELFARLEAVGFFLRVDPDTPATFLRGSIVSESELDLLRRIDDVVRLGHVQRIESDRIVLDEGFVPTTTATLHVHCAAHGVARRPLRPIFDGHRVTVQPIMFGPGCYMFAFIGVVEALLDGDADKNQLCRPVVAWENDVEYLAAFLAAMTVQRNAAIHPELLRWTKTTRLSPTSGLDARRDDPIVVEARQRIKTHAAAAVQRVQEFLTPAD
jgi:hypothetical protein